MSLSRLFLRIFKYTAITCLILIGLAATALFLFQDKIISLTFREINKHLTTKIEIDRNVNLSLFEKFPEISIRVKNVRVYGNPPDSIQKLADLRTLYFSFDAYDFIRGQYVLKNIYAEKGEINLRIDENGKGNYFIFKSDTTSESNISFDLQKIVLKEVKVSYINKPIHQDHSIYVQSASSSLKFKDQSWFIGLKGDMQIHHIGVGENYYFKDKQVSLNSNQEFHEAKSLFQIHPSVVLVEGSEFNLSGFYDGSQEAIELNLKAGKGSISTLLSLLPGHLNKKLSTYKSSGNIYFDATIKGVMNAEESPSVDVNFGFTDASFFHPDINKKIEKATLSGSFTNGDKHHLSSSTLKLEDVKGLFDGKDISGDLLLENFEDPFVKLSLHGTFDANSLLQFYRDSDITDASGTIQLDLNFEGKTNQLKTQEGKEKVKAEGEIVLSNLNVKINKHPIEYSSINADLRFNKNDLEIKNFSGIAGKSDFVVRGSFKNFVYKMLTGKQKLNIEADLESKNLNLNELMTAFSGGESSKENKGTYPYLEDYSFKINCRIDQLEYQRLYARAISGKVEFSQPIAYLKDLQFKTAGGSVKTSSVINFRSAERIEFNTRTSFSGIYIDSVFHVFENFNQDYITEKNLKGQYTGDVQLFFVMNHNMDISTSSVIASIDATITNGELNDFEPMKALSRFIDEKKLENIKFSELKNTIYIKNNIIEIPEMEIVSNAATISVAGTHSFEQMVDYKLSILLKGIRKERTDKDAAFGAIEEDAKGNSRLFLTMKGKADDPVIAWDRKRTMQKVKTDLKKEKQEFLDIFKKKKPEEKNKPTEVESLEEMETAPSTDEYFDF